jgi:hypothetical protein
VNESSMLDNEIGVCLFRSVVARITELSFNGITALSGACPTFVYHEDFFLLLKMKVHLFSFLFGLIDQDSSKLLQLGVPFLQGLYFSIRLFQCCFVVAIIVV